MDEHLEPLDAGRSVDQLQVEIDRLAAENADLGARLRRRATARSLLTGALVVVTSLMLVASTVAVWGKRTVFDTDRFMTVVDPALDDPAFYDSLSRNVSDQVIEVLDLETRVRERLTQLDQYLAEELVDALGLGEVATSALSLFDRPTLADLTPSIVDPLEERVRGGITGFITSDEFQQRLPLLVRRAHEATLALIDDDLSEFPNVYVADGEVRINLIPVIVDALERVIDLLTGYLPDISLPAFVSDRVDEAREELAAALTVQLPEDFGQLTVMSDESLSSLQDGAQRINRVTWLIVAVTAALLVLTLVVSTNRRRTVVWLSIGITAALAAAWWTIGRIRSAVLDEVAEPDSRAAIAALLEQTRQSFRTYLLVVVVIAVIAGVVAFAVAHLDALASGGRWVRSQLDGEPTPLNRWVSAHYDGLRVGGFVAAAVLLLLIGIDVVPFLVIGGLLGLYLLALGATRRGEPEAAPATSDA